jgi:hypothetical protein
MHARSRTQLAWLLFLATFGCLAGGLAVTLAVTRPLTADVLIDGALEAGIWLLFATLGLVLTLRRPTNPIGWLYAAAALVWTAYIPWDPWVDQLQRTGRPLPPAAQLRRLLMGGRPHPRHHLAAAAAAERAVALAPLADRGGRKHRRHDH